MAGLREVILSTTPSAEAIADLRLGDIVYLDGLMYTAREGVYMRALEEQANIPMALPAVTATASFRFAKWLPEWMAKTGAKLIVGKGGMTSRDYREYFVPNGAVYLSTVGYGTGALLGRGVEAVEAVHWHEELGLAQAMWVIRCKRMGPFIVASDLNGDCLFERENAKIAENIERVYEGTRPAVLKRYGESDDRSDEVI